MISNHFFPPLCALKDPMEMERNGSHNTFAQAFLFGLSGTNDIWLKHGKQGSISRDDLGEDS